MKLATKVLASTGLMVALASGAAMAQTAPMAPNPMMTGNMHSPVRGDCMSAHNLAKIHRRLDGAIDRLNHDQKDYAGHRVAAIQSLTAARQEIMAAEDYSKAHEAQGSHCFNTDVKTGGGDQAWGTRTQGESNESVARVRRWVEKMIDQLQRDQRDYDGHRVAAIRDMQQARQDLLAAEQAR